MADNSNPFMVAAPDTDAAAANPFMVPAETGNNDSLDDLSGEGMSAMTPHDVGQLLSGAAGAVAGAPGDIIGSMTVGKLMQLLAPGSELAVNLAKIIASPEVSKQISAFTDNSIPNPFPTSQDVTNFLAGPSSGPGDTALRTVGNIGGNVAISALAPVVAETDFSNIARTAGNVAKSVGEVPSIIKGALTPEIAPKSVATTFEPDQLSTDLENEGLAFRQKGVELHQAYQGARTAAAQPALDLAKLTAKNSGADQQAGKDITSYLVSKYTGKSPFLRPAVQELVGNDIQNPGDTSTAMKKLLQWTENEIRTPDGKFKSIEGIDNVIRDLNDEGKVGEIIGGASAKEQIMARTIAGNMRRILQLNSPEYGAYLNAYKANSIPLQPFEQNNIGQNLVGRANGIARKLPSEYNYDTDFNTPTEKLPDKIFASQQGYQTGKQIYGAQFMKERATNYAAYKLSSTISGRIGPSEAAGKVGQFLKKNAWVNEPENVQLKQNLTDLQSVLKSIHTTRTVLLSGAAVAAMVSSGLSIWGLRALIGNAIR